MNQTKTSRTDAVFERNKKQLHIVCLAELEVESRNLERELNEAIKQRDALAEALRDIMTFDHKDGQCDSGFTPNYAATKALANFIIEVSKPTKGGEF